MNRRSFLQLTTLAAVSGLAGSKVACSGGGSGSEKPNILLFVADDLGWGDVGFHGSVCRTPNIDRLARSGVEMEQFYVCPQCSPTRLSLLTGRYSSRFGVNAATNDPTMPLGTPALASILKDCGYRILLSGKWHLGSDYEPAYGEVRKELTAELMRLKRELGDTDEANV